MIGCNQDHIFCKQCLDQYYDDNQIKSCPVCRETGLKRETLKISRSTERVINSLKIQCPLQLQQDESNNIYDFYECNCKGEFGDVSKHIRQDCPLKIVACNNCLEKMERGKLMLHDGDILK